MSTVKNIIQSKNFSSDHFVFDATTKTIRLVDSIVNPTIPESGVTKLEFSSADKKVYWTLKGVDHEYDFSGFLTDIHVTGAKLENGVLKLQQDGGPEVSIDLEALSRVTTSNTGNVTFTGNGTAQSPLVGNVDLPTYTASNGIVKTGNDFALDKASVFDVELQDAFGETIGYASSVNA